MKDLIKTRVFYRPHKLNQDWMESMAMFRSCWICKNLDYDNGDKAWSDETPGNPPAARCVKRSGVHLEFFTGSAKEQAMNIAANCEEFEPEQGR